MITEFVSILAFLICKLCCGRPLVTYHQIYSHCTLYRSSTMPLVDSNRERLLLSFFQSFGRIFFFCKFRNLYARSLLPYFDHAFFPAPFFLLHTVQSGMTAVVVGTIPEQLLIPAVTESCFCTTLKRSRRSEFCHSKFLYYSEDFLGDQFFISLLHFVVGDPPAIPLNPSSSSLPIFMSWRDEQIQI